MSGELVELTRFPSASEAALARGRLDAEGIRSELSGEAAANALSHLGSTLVGVRLLVSQQDAERAIAILGEEPSSADLQGVDFGDDSDDEPPDSEQAELCEDLLRAWRASLIGLVLCPPLLNLYSMWLLMRHWFFAGRCRNWRVPATCAVNALVLLMVCLFVWLIANPPPGPPQYYLRDGEPLGEPMEIEIETDVQLIPVVP